MVIKPVELAWHEFRTSTPDIRVGSGGGLQGRPSAFILTTMSSTGCEPLQNFTQSHASDHGTAGSLAPLKGALARLSISLEPRMSREAPDLSQEQASMSRQLPELSRRIRRVSRGVREMSAVTKGGADVMSSICPPSVHRALPAFPPPGASGPSRGPPKSGAGPPQFSCVFRCAEIAF